MITITGTVSNRKVLTRLQDPDYVKADLVCADGVVERVVWWDANQAPPNGKRVSVSGAIKVYKGDRELHARTTRVERDLPDNPLARLVGYYLECIEAEASTDTSVLVGASDHVEITQGRCPMSGTAPVALNDTPAVRAWCAQRQNAIGETVLIGYPVVVGPRDNEVAAAAAAVPLFLAEARIVGLTVQCPGESIELNRAALSHLGLSSDERDECLSALDSSAEYEEANTAVDRLMIGVAILASVSGHPQLTDLKLDPDRLTRIAPAAEGVQNSCLVLATSGGGFATGKLVEELEQMIRQPQDLSKGPLGVLLGAVNPLPAPLPQAHPIVVPSTLRQDQAVHAAMTNAFTVVTGPPGTGKSQVLVNVVTAAVSQGQSVLFASKNNKAVDVVLERIRQVSPRANVMRAGAASFRPGLAASIGDALGRVASPSPNNAAARLEQTQLSQRLNVTYAKLQERFDLEAVIESKQRTCVEMLTLLPHGADMSFDEMRIEHSGQRVSAALRAFGEGLPVLRRSERWRIHRSRLDEAQLAGDELSSLLESFRLGHFDVVGSLSDVSDKPKRSLKPAKSLGPVEATLVAARRAKIVQAEIDVLLQRLEAEYQTWGIENQLAGYGEERLRVGRQFIDGCWDVQLSGNQATVNEVRLLLSEINAAATGGAGARAARTRMPAVLRALPAWGVTNLSAGTNFPLNPQMFDLVVIDEASQCDIASALPLLYRAKRALIIGDSRQLTHITAVSRAREEGIARKWQTPDETHSQFCFKGNSAFALAALRVGEPLLLDLHFRSQAAIITFSNKQFYNRRLEVCTTSSPRRHEPAHEPTVRWRNVDGDVIRGRNGKSWRNPKEAAAVVDELGSLLPMLHGTGQSVGVVAAYRAQVEEIRELAHSVLGDSAAEVSIDTAHKFQGDERDVMLFSPVIGPSMTPQQTKFASDPNLINVALTRARNRLIVVGNLSACMRDETVIAEFARYVAQLEASVFDSPLELALFDELLARGVQAVPGRLVAGYRLDLALETDKVRLDVECDGAPFHASAAGAAADKARDANIELQGWRVLRLTGRELSRDIKACADKVLKALV